MNNYEIKRISKNEISEIKELWDRLNSLHFEKSENFKDHFKNFSFDMRSEEFKDIMEENIFIEVAYDNNKKTGYCISTCRENTGEIDSLYIKDEYRKTGIGSELINNGIKWLKEKNCSKIEIKVADGNESVLDFYRKSGFYKRFTCLELKE